MSTATSRAEIMISAILPLDQAPAAFKRLEAREDAKIILIP